MIDHTHIAWHHAPAIPPGVRDAVIIVVVALITMTLYLTVQEIVDRIRRVRRYRRSRERYSAQLDQMREQWAEERNAVQDRMFDGLGGLYLAKTLDERRAELKDLSKRIKDGGLL